MDYRENEIAVLSASIVAFLSKEGADIEIKLAALKAATSTIDAAISAKAQLVALQSILAGPRR
ncbi:hypothetical protein [Aureimonas sp. N4]|uniref:hypothetical protein n=1 Tax=Aureimonas sp. N4 TaxID=1638165 RepID=UPI00078610C2|nr:hypothetical protein [Aureimonas sp. N4]